MQKLPGANYVWEAGRLKSGSTNVEEAWKSHAICQTAAVKCVLSWVSECSQFIITIIIQDVYIHTRAISRGVQSLKEYTAPHARARDEQFTTVRIYMQRCCRTEQIPLCVQPSCCHCESSGRRVTEPLFWWFLFVGVKKFALFWNQSLLLQRQWRWNGKCLQWNCAKTTCGENNISDWDFTEFIFADHKVNNIMFFMKVAVEYHFI